VHIVGDNVALDVVDVAERDVAVELVAGRVVETLEYRGKEHFYFSFF